MPHVELSLTENTARLQADRAHPAPVADEPYDAPSIERWSAVVTAAPEPCLVIDCQHVIVAASLSCCAMIGLGDPDAVRGQVLLDAVALLDFADGEQLDTTEAQKIPPVLAIKSKRLARGLMRVAIDAPPGQHTMDSIATPLSNGAEVIGSLTFFAQV